jgi:Domain of unknown function (DUF4157)/OmpA family
MSSVTYARKAAAPFVAPALKIGQPDDAFEREADRTADEVINGAGTAQWSFPRVSVEPRLQRKCSCASGEEDCEECKSKGTLQRKAAGMAEMSQAPTIVHDVLRSGGTPLDRTTRSFMERRFGHDFGDVRIHSDARAAESARAVGALAYTVDNKIAFDSGRYAPHTQQGRKLLAHELTHVVQQGGAGGTAAKSPRAVQRLAANPSAIPKDIHCFTDQGPKGTSATSLTGVKLAGALNSAQQKQVAQFYKTWTDAGAKDFIAVEGYASAETANDSEAQQKANWIASCSRTEIVQKALVKLGVPAKLILAWGHGETDQFSPVGKDPDSNRRVELSLISMQKAGTASTAGPATGAPTGIQVKGTAGEQSAQVDVKTTGGKQAAGTTAADQAQQKQKTDESKQEGDKPKADADDDKPFSITVEFDLKNDFKKTTPPDAVPAQGFLCDHGIYQIGFKWNKGIKIHKNSLQLLNEPEFDVNILDPACQQNPSLTLQVNVVKYTILRKILEADLVGVVGLPDGWATGLHNFPFTAGAQLKLETTPFARRFPSLDGIKIGGYGGLGFEQGVEIPGAGEEKATRVWTVGGYIGLDHDFDFSRK